MILPAQNVAPLVNSSPVSPTELSLTVGAHSALPAIVSWQSYLQPRSITAHPTVAPLQKGTKSKAIGSAKQA